MSLASAPFFAPPCTATRYGSSECERRTACCSFETDSTASPHCSSPRPHPMMAVGLG